MSVFGVSRAQRVHRRRPTRQWTRFPVKEGRSLMSGRFAASIGVALVRNVISIPMAEQSGSCCRRSFRVVMSSLVRFDHPLPTETFSFPCLKKKRINSEKEKKSSVAYSNSFAHDVMWNWWLDAKKPTIWIDKIERWEAGRRGEVFDGIRSMPDALRVGNKVAKKQNKGAKIISWWKGKREGNKTKQKIAIRLTHSNWLDSTSLLAFAYCKGSNNFRITPVPWIIHRLH